MQQTTQTTRYAVSTKPRPRFKMRFNNKNKSSNNNIIYNYKHNSSIMLNIFLFFLSCCCACALCSLAVEAANPTKSAGATAPATTTPSIASAAYLDVNSVENSAALSTDDGDVAVGVDGVAANNNNNNNIPTADVAADEILQLPHAFRHQEHYSHRIEQAVNDFKRAQLEQQLQLKQLQQQQQEQQQQTDFKSSTVNATKANYNSNNWQEESKLKQQQPQHQPHHHRRHEQHLKQHQSQFEVQQQQQQQHHHLRHHNRHHASWEQRVFPALRHQRHQQHEHHLRPTVATTTTTTTTTLSPLYASNELETLPRAATINVTRALQTRYFDRDGLYSKPRAAAASHVSAVWVRATRGPRVRHMNANSWPSAKKLDEREFSDEANYDEDDDDDDDDGGREFIDNIYNDNDVDDASVENDAATNHLNGNRFTLKLNAHDMSMSEKTGATVNKNSNELLAKKQLEQANNNNGNDNEEDLEDDADDDYSYEDDELPKTPHALTSNAVKEKISVKRYTNPFKSSYKSSPKQHYETAYEDDDDMDESRHENFRHNLNNKNNNFNKNNNYDNTDNDDTIDTSDNDDADDDNSSSSESDDSFSNDKWNRIEQQHHLKQLQHQRELPRRQQHHATSGSGRNAAVTNSANTNAAKRQIKYDDDVDSIFSRNYIPGTLTRQKQEELGTLEAVHQTRRNHVMKQMQHKALANAHARQIFSEASCRLPQRRIERIQRDPTKIYTPHCTVLHRCADDTGCCKSDRQTCAPKRTKSVDLYFFVKGINDKRGSIERLTFINHTECHCVDKAKEQPSEYGGNAALYGGLGGNSQMLRRATILNCNCPKLYEKILQEDGFCRCDCSSGNTGCDWLKRGMEHFSMIDRKCISEGRCKPPTCAYGSYIKKHGRCPRREEQLSATLIGGAGGGGATPLATNSIKLRGYH